MFFKKNVFRLDHRYNYISPEIYVETKFSEKIILALVSYVEELCIENGFHSYEDSDFFDEEVISNFFVFFFKANRFEIEPPEYEVLDLYESTLNDFDKNLAVKFLKKYKIKDNQIVRFIQPELEKIKNKHLSSVLKMDEY